MSRRLPVREALEIAFFTGQQVTIILKSRTVLEGVVVEALWETAFRVWLNPNQAGGDVDKAIVAIHAVKAIIFNNDTTNISDRYDTDFDEED